MRVRVNIAKRRDQHGELLRKDCPVLISVTFSGQRVVLQGGITVAMDDWDAATRRIIASHPLSADLNLRIETLLKCVQDAWKVMEAEGGEATSRRFREIYYTLRPDLSSGFFQLFYRFMEEQGVRWSRSAYLKARKLYDLLREFEQKNSLQLSFAGMNSQFAGEFETFLAGKAYSASTIRRNINILVWFLNWASANSYNIYREYRNFYRQIGGKGAKPRPVVVCLTEKELELLGSLTVNARKGEQVRDLFMLTALTGIRYSELLRIKRGDLVNGVIQLKRQDGHVFRIRPGKMAADILIRYENRFYKGGSALPYVAPLTYQKWIRQIAAEAGLERNLSIPKKEGVALTRICDLLGAPAALNTYISLVLSKENPDVSGDAFGGLVNAKRIEQVKRALGNRIESEPPSF